jgi:hypothetical protein
VEVQAHAFDALGRIEALPRPSLEELRKLNFASLSAPRAHAALAALGEAGTKAAFAIRPLQAWYSRQETRPSVKLAILDTLPLLGDQGGWYVATLFQVHKQYAEPPYVSDEITDKMEHGVRKLDGSGKEAAEVLIAQLRSDSEAQQQLAAEALIKHGPLAAAADPILANLLRQDDGHTNPRTVGNYLEVVRAIGPQAVESRAAIAELLDPRAAIYRGRVNAYVHLLRGYMFAVLADIGVPKTALPQIVDALADPSDQRWCAAAARAAGTLGPAASDAVPALVAILEAPVNYYDAVDLSRFGSHRRQLAKGATTARLEAIRALERIGEAATPALPTLRTIGSYKDPDFSKAHEGGYEGIENSVQFAVPRLEAEAAKSAISAIERQAAVPKKPERLPASPARDERGSKGANR